VNSIVIPVYQNATVLDSLVANLQSIAERACAPLEVLFIDDGSTDGSAERLRELISRGTNFQSRILRHNENRGAFTAAQTGFAQAAGDYIATMSADGQEPPELILRFFAELANGRAKVALGYRTDRRDPWTRKILAQLYWRLLRWKTGAPVSPWGVDVLAVTRDVRDWLLVHCPIPNQMVVALYSSGFAWVDVPFERLGTRQQKSHWTLRKRIRYAFASFTYRPGRITP